MESAKSMIEAKEEFYRVNKTTEKKDGFLSKWRELADAIMSTNSTSLAKSKILVQKSIDVREAHTAEMVEMIEKIQAESLSRLKYFKYYSSGKERPSSEVINVLNKEYESFKNYLQTLKDQLKEDK